MRTTKSNFIVWKTSKEGEKMPISCKTLPYLSQISSNMILAFQNVSGTQIKDLMVEIDFQTEEMEHLFGVGRTALYNIISMQSISSRHLDTISNFARVLKKGYEAFEYDADDLTTFLKRENKNLGNIKPQELLYTESGRRALEATFNRIKYGVFG